MNNELVTQLYGVSDLAAALKVPHGYVTPLLNRGIFCPTHRWGSYRLFTRDRIEEIVREHGSLIRVTAPGIGTSNQAERSTANEESAW